MLLLARGAAVTCASGRRDALPHATRLAAAGSYATATHVVAAGLPPRVAPGVAGLAPYRGGLLELHANRLEVRRGDGAREGAWSLDERWQWLAVCARGDEVLLLADRAGDTRLFRVRRRHAEV